MTGWVILVDSAKDFPNAETPHKVITTREYLARPKLFETAGPKILNLSRSYNYQSWGYYASLLAEARGQRVMPTVETLLELGTRAMYEPALPEIEDALNRCAQEGAPVASSCVPAARLLRPGAGQALRGVRPARLRLVPGAGAGDQCRARPVADHQPHPRARLQQALGR